MHPEDRESTLNVCMALSNKGTDHEADYQVFN
ncbi:hypothetical protein [Acinetobacter sp. ANC 5502]